MQDQADPVVLDPAAPSCDRQHGLEFGECEIGVAVEDRHGDRLGGAPVPVGFAGGDQRLTQRLARARLLLLNMNLMIHAGGAIRLLIAS